MLPELLTLTGPLGGLEGVELPLTPLEEISWADAILGHPIVKALGPLPLLAIAAPAIWYLFRGWWRDADLDATRFRQELAAKGDTDLRPAACLALTAVILTLQEYFGGRGFYDTVVKPVLVDAQAVGYSWLKVTKYDELYSYVWWSFARVFGYTAIPLVFWKIAFPRDAILDMGFRVRGFFEHLWIYGALYGVVLVGMAIFATQDTFVAYYPFYRASSRSYFDLILWESIYWGQFVGLEVFFRGWMVGAMRHSLGSISVFAMAVPYCMIHYGKPYEEALGAILAGIVLGSIVLKTRSIWGGLLVHLAVAATMDLLSLFTRDALPTTFWAPG